ncbi:hypothetical protein BaRGS_00014596, partial [Batillaria attramentaria]
GPDSSKPQTGFFALQFFQLRAGVSRQRTTFTCSPGQHLAYVGAGIVLRH